MSSPTLENFNTWRTEARKRLALAQKLRCTHPATTIEILCDLVDELLKREKPL
jgi:hypothetical protein